MKTEIDLFTPIKLGPYDLQNRIVLAPLTRNRAGTGNVPTAVNALYYVQRATAGIIISEATQVSEQGIGYPNTPGIYTREQIAGWRLVTNSVHAIGGRIFLQLWHVGRISHPDFQPNGELPVAPSAIAAIGQTMTVGKKPFPIPRALETFEIPGIVEQYRQAAANALEAGFDGVEIHAANGYLLNQFMEDNTNHRTDQYGDSVENRTRLPFEVIDAVRSIWGSERVGVRISPGGSFNSMNDSAPAKTYEYFVEELNKYELAYLHIVEPDTLDRFHVNGLPTSPTHHLRKKFNGMIITNKNYDKEIGNQTLKSGNADMVAYGRLFIANPDLPKRFAIGAELNPPDTNSFYGGGDKGYIDYPAL